MKKLQLKYSTPKIKLNSVKKLCENKDISSNIKIVLPVAQCNKFVKIGETNKKQYYILYIFLLCFAGLLYGFMLQND